ncbi:MAG: alpha/beta hydrolase [Ardenticatenaceae bacterium]|nr:alpha/beta hydrolase [Ardenticatenaceae bacterium]
MRPKQLTTLIACVLAGILSYQLLLAQPEQPGATFGPAGLQPPSTSQESPQTWGQLVTWDGVTTTYAVYKQNFVYGSVPFLITDIRTETKYSDKHSYEMRSLTVYRAHDDSHLLDNQPVIFFVHGGAWTDGYENWYDFVAQSFTGEKGWVTVVIDYRLTSDQVFIADEHCPDRDTCNSPENVPLRTKAAWYRDNIEDVASAFQWVVDNIAGNGGNADQIVAFGHSAGGHLVSLLATHPNYSALRPAMKGLISMSGAYLLKELSMVTFASDIDQTFQGGHIDNDAELDEASPSTYVIAGMPLPPFYVLHAQRELPSLYEQALAFRNTLESRGLAVEYDYLAGYDHSTEMEAIADISTAPTALIVNFIETVLDLNDQQVYLPLLVR